MKRFLACLSRKESCERGIRRQPRLTARAPRRDDLAALVKSEQSRGMPAFVGGDARRSASEGKMKQNALLESGLVRFY